MARRVPEPFGDADAVQLGRVGRARARHLAFQPGDPAVQLGPLLRRDRHAQRVGVEFGRRQRKAQRVGDGDQPDLVAADILRGVVRPAALGEAAGERAPADMAVGLQHRRVEARQPPRRDEPGDAGPSTATSTVRRRAGWRFISKSRAADRSSAAEASEPARRSGRRSIPCPAGYRSRQRPSRARRSSMNSMAVRPVRSPISQARIIQGSASSAVHAPCHRRGLGMGRVLVPGKAEGPILVALDAPGMNVVHGPVVAGRARLTRLRHRLRDGVDRHARDPASARTDMPSTSMERI